MFLLEFQESTLKKKSIAFIFKYLWLGGIISHRLISYPSSMHDSDRKKHQSHNVPRSTK